MSDVVYIPPDYFVRLTLYSFINTIIVTSIFILLLVFITGRIKFLPKINIAFTYMSVLIIGIRLLLPFEFCFTKGISSPVIMHGIKEAVNIPVIPIFADNSINVLHILCLIWILGAVICLSKYFAGYYFLYKKANLMLPCEDDRINKILTHIKDKHGFNFNTKIVIFQVFNVPSEFGLFKETIFLNDKEYSDRELYYILLHELEHFHNKSNWINMFLSVICCVYWWNPIVKLFKNHINELIETYVDNFVTKELVYNEKVDYLNCIFNIYKTDDKIYNDFMTEAIIGTGKNNKLLNRFKVVIDNKKINIPICILLLFVMSFYVFCSGRYVIQSSGEPPKEDLANIMDGNANNSYIVKENGYYVLYYNGEGLMRSSDLKDLPNDVPYLEN